jgi:hypothetical protein
MNHYAVGNGHVDLADRFNVLAKDLSISGSANSRILRTTLKHSYETDLPTLYVLGLTFISREELPICRYDPGIDPTEDEVWEGAWTNPQNQQFGKNRWVEHWGDKDTKQWVVFREKYETISLVDRLENLMYQMLSLLDSLTYRGHRCIIFQQADEWWHGVSNLDFERIKLLNNKNIIGNFRWCAIRWQHQQGVPYIEGDSPLDIRHRESGKHKILNEYLENYIRQHELHL